MYAFVRSPTQTRSGYNLRATVTVNSTHDDGDQEAALTAAFNVLNGTSSSTIDLEHPTKNKIHFQIAAHYTCRGSFPLRTLQLNDYLLTTSSQKTQHELANIRRIFRVFHPGLYPLPPTL